jgi:aryl-alcohol dehydrogenase-like predicted oxidoreductase
VSKSIKDIPFSRLVVGTAQFGLPYGIANRVGQPSPQEVCDILACAVEGGATTLDTASEYGESEAVLGQALSQIDALDRVTLISKVRHVKHMEQEPTLANVENWIRDSVVSSLKRLGIESLPLCMFHDAADIIYMDVLLALKEEGLVQHIGVSLFAPEQVEDAIVTPGVEAIQVASSLLDQRILRSGALDWAVEAGLAIFVRSIYLQGLLVMPLDKIMPELQAVVPVRRTLHRICDEAGMTMAELALRYGLSLAGVTGVLTGVETVEQMAANLEIAARGPLPQDMVQEINRAVPDLPDTLLNPWHWPGAMR